METCTLFFLAVGVSMDALAVSISNGLCYKDIGLKETLWTALVFGVFQAAMPVLGFLAGSTMGQAIEAIDHWVVLLLLGFIGARMVHAAIKEMRHPESCTGNKVFSAKILLMQGVATSIDALAVGVGFAVLQVNIVYAASFFGVVTFVCCGLGAHFGRKLGVLFKEKAQIVGGVILIAIGIKVFLEHVL